MISENILNLIFSFFSFISTLMPDLSNLDINIQWMEEFISILKTALNFIPNDVFVAYVTTVVFWMWADYAWQLIMFIVRKIPGVS